MLALFMAFGFMSTSQWVQYSIIANIVMRYYNVSSYAVDWTSILFMAVYIPLVFPATYFFDKLGLRKGLLVGVALMAVGTWIKCGSAEPSRYAVTLTGQTFVGMSQAFLLSVPPHIASTWFGSDEVSTACSLGILGLQLGVAASFLAPSMMVGNHENLDDVGRDLARMFYIVAGVCTALLLLTAFLFQEKPPLPPSVEALLHKGQSKTDFRASLRRLFRSRNFLALMITYGFNLSVFNAFSTLLNQLILIYFAEGQELAGRVGLVFVTSGMIGSVICGVFLDKTHRFRESIVAIYVLSTALLLVLTFIMALKSELLVYLVGGAFGTFMGGYMTVSFEYGVELTYPECESTMAGMLLLSSQVMSVFITMLYGWLLNEAGDVWANVALTAFMAAGTVITALIRPDLRRQAAHAAAAPDSPAPAHTTLAGAEAAATDADADAEADPADGEADALPEAVKLVQA
ncbi:hypothetical protein R5R35_000102 [Gryllus longicercus]